MAKDRLSALQAVIEQLDEDEEGIDNVAIEIDDEEGGYMERFFSMVQMSRGWIEEIEKNVKEIKSIHSLLLSSPRPEERLKNELDERTYEVKTISQKVNRLLKEMEKEIELEEEELGLKEKNLQAPARLRMRRSAHSSCLFYFIEVMESWNKEQNDYRQKCVERIHRLASIAKAVVTDERLDELLEQGNYGAIFNDDIITETIEARRALEDVQVRHEELLKIEKSLQELRDLFIDMAILIEHQGELVNRIENHVLSTVDYVDVAKVEMNKAIKYQKKSRKNLIILIIFIVLIIIILISIYLMFHYGVI
ncbi:syntaxin-1A isoform X1 [Halyomorpha halys]|uniref:syntaxin-1A isoform X1 n=1 Tax=Halyomorpha halys TaxID=286706 RepID=UPI0006D51216|nr:syntaxin isoform X1 [Halyomorpha halys]